MTLLGQAVLPRVPPRPCIVRPFTFHPKVSDDTYTPTGVISRNILTDEVSPLGLSESAVSDQVPVAELQPVVVAAAGQREERSDRKQEVLFQEEVLKGNYSATEENRVESVGIGLPSPPAGGAVVDSDTTKPAHADEM
ncbi:hypothetical protein Baya_5434 [Bagarius yarrelli]|uniref:Uncharacterized protein n=1 Tax=Bagarius yarrelli TaxID=175774 RepID=A0A556TUN6_BAGYA|nr:hypothetical protein Baya_5434 [Bagarius yarrelli]